VTDNVVTSLAGHIRKSWLSIASQTYSSTKHW